MLDVFQRNQLKNANMFFFSQGESNYTQVAKLQMMKRCTPSEWKLILLKKFDSFILFL